MQRASRPPSSASSASPSGSARGRSSRPRTTIFWWKSLGVMLWCWVVHACVRFVNPRLTVAAAAAWTLGLSWAVELAQLTDLPRWLSSKHWFLRQVFGEVFSPWDLLGAAVAALLVMPVDAALRGMPWPVGRPHAARSTPSSPAAQTSPASVPPCSRR
ncbi:MAG TPA: DUF2809 domain-containing protein [Phycisphaerales bacterium]|nr:DUF2809 domain-containing protein [Phycisphaerales bacterium]